MGADINDVEQTIRSYSLKTFRKPVAELVNANLHRSVEFDKLPEVPIGTGDSKIGGYPDLISPDQIPHFEQRPLTFIAQFNCEDLAGLPFFPEEGLISVFIDLNGPPNKFPNRAGQYAVIYCPTTVNPVERDLCVSGSTAEQRLGPIRTIAAPYYNSHVFSEVDLSSEEQDELIELSFGFIPDQVGAGGVYSVGAPPDPDALYEWIYQYLGWVGDDSIADYEKQLNAMDQQRISELQKEFITIFSMPLDELGFNDCWIHLGIHLRDLAKKKFNRVFVAYLLT